VKSRFMITCFVGLLLIFTMVPVATHAAVPQQINYQGLLTNSDGTPVSDGNYEMSFAIYNVPTGGTWLWSESHTVAVTKGIYNVILGNSGNELDPGIFDGNLYLGVAVEPDLEEMVPRQEITATAFAMKAAKADSVADGAVTSVMIAEGAVTTEKVADNAVTAAKIVDGTVTAADIQDGEVLAEIIDNDGQGSGLDADTLDGLDSSSFLSTYGGLADLDHSNLLVRGTGGFNATDEEGILYLGDTNNYIKAIHGYGVRIGAFGSDDALGIQQGTGNVGIGTTNAQALLHVNAPHDTDGLILGPPTTEWTGETYRMRIRNGFGDGFLQTASGGPQFLLSYNSYRDNDGTWNATYPAYPSAMVNLNPGGIFFQTGTGATHPDVTTHMKIQSDGSVTIPNGSVKIGSDNKQLSMFTDGTFVDIASTGSALAMNYKGNTDTLINVEAGNVGIGTTDPDEKLEVAGNLKVSGTGNGIVFPDGTVQTTAPAPTWHQKLPAAERFELVMDGEAVLDKETGLVWARNANIDGAKTWQDAINYCANLSISDRKGWRLPKREELSSLLDMSESDVPMLPRGYQIIFENVIYWSCYWSGTKCEGSESYAWKVCMYDGDVEVTGMTAPFYVWPVRTAN